MFLCLTNEHELYGAVICSIIPQNALNLNIFCHSFIRAMLQNAVNIAFDNAVIFSLFFLLPVFRVNGFFLFDEPRIFRLGHAKISCPNLLPDYISLIFYNKV